MDRFGSYRGAWETRRVRARAADIRAQGEALRCARRIAALLLRQYRVRRVILCGSLARGEFRRGSDIDLAVDGLATDRLFAAGRDAEALADGRDVDLVPLESASDTYREMVAREGVRLDDAIRS